LKDQLAAKVFCGHIRIDHARQEDNDRHQFANLRSRYLCKPRAR
jgi:hypothetical protein